MWEDSRYLHCEHLVLKIFAPLATSPILTFDHFQIRVATHYRLPIPAEIPLGGVRGARFIVIAKLTMPAQAMEERIRQVPKVSNSACSRKKREMYKNLT